MASAGSERSFWRLACWIASMLAQGAHNSFIHIILGIVGSGLLTLAQSPLHAPMAHRRALSSPSSCGGVMLV